LVEIDDGPYQAALTQAEGELIRDQAALENARIDLVRYQQLVPQKAIPEQQLATQQATVHQDEGVVKLDQGQIESAKVNLAYCKIAAPATGRIGLRLVDPGNIVQATDTTDWWLSHRWIPSAPSLPSPKINFRWCSRRCCRANARMDAYSRDAKTKLAQGSLTTLDNQIDPATGTLKL